MKFLKIVLISLFSIVVIIGLTILIASLIVNNKTNSTNDDYKNVYTNEKYSSAYSIDNIEVFEQKVSCGYAVIEMFAKWDNKDITEKSLFDKYNGVVTSTGGSFENEMNKQFTNYKTTMYKYLKNTELIDKVYNSLKNGIPVPFEWAAKYKEEWTLHYSLIVGINIKEDKIKIANTYGYYEELSLADFISRTNFTAYKSMPIFLKLGFAFGIFEKNTIFIVEHI